jgi:hypothetical protein
MKWSKLKQRIENNFAVCLHGRLQIYATCYAKKENYGRCWMTFDKKEIINFCDYQSWNNFQSYYHEETVAHFFASHKSPEDKNRKEGNLIELGEYSKLDVSAALFEYLNLPIEDCIAHEHKIIQGFAMLDRRVGKRQFDFLKTIAIHPFVKGMLELRISTEEEERQKEAFKKR